MLLQKKHPIIIDYKDPIQVNDFVSYMDNLVALNRSWLIYSNFDKILELDKVALNDAIASGKTDDLDTSKVASSSKCFIDIINGLISRFSIYIMSDDEIGNSTSDNNCYI